MNYTIALAKYINNSFVFERLIETSSLIGKPDTEAKREIVAKYVYESLAKRG